jgi:hypothetical protein
MTREEFIEQEAQRRFEQKYGKDWYKNPESRARLLKEFEEGQKQAKERNKKELEQVKADMRSGKTSTLVGKESLRADNKDPYAGVQGPLPRFETQEQADVSGESRYLIPRPPKSPRGGVSGREMVSPRGEGIEVRKPQEAARRMYRAVIRGEPASDELFETKEEAQEYLKKTGKEGVVAGISFKGKSAEELASKETAYRGGLAAEKERASELKDLYAARREESADRVSRMRQAAEEYDAATTPEGKAAAKSKAEDVRLESLREEALRDWERRGLPFETSPFGWDKIQERRKKREEETRVKTEQARAQTRERQAVKAGEESAKRGLSQFDSIIKPLYKASREARRGRDYVTQSNIERRIERFTAGVPTEPKARLRYFNTNEGRARLNFITEELVREQDQREKEKVIQNWNAS